MIDFQEDEGIKVVVVGDGSVGKTCLLRRFVRGDFIEQYKKTIGAEFMEKDVFLRAYNVTVKLLLWDTAGQEVFNALTRAYYRGAGVAVLAFSTVDRDSFMNVEAWKERVESVCGPIPMVLCQTKLDLSHEAVITNDEAEHLATQLKVPFFRVSTKDDFNVTQLFEFAAQQCVDARRLQSARASQHPSAAAHPASLEPTHEGGGRGGGAAAGSTPSPAPAASAVPTASSASPATATAAAAAGDGTAPRRSPTAAPGGSPAPSGGGGGGVEQSASSTTGHRHRGSSGETAEKKTVKLQDGDGDGVAKPKKKRKLKCTLL